jgi:hypothetical protein
VPAGKSAGLPGADPLKYQPTPEELREDASRYYVGGLKDADKPRPSPDDSLRPEIRRKSAGLPGADPLKYQPTPEELREDVRRYYVGGLKDADKPRPSPDDSLRPEIRRKSAGLPGTDPLKYQPTPEELREDVRRYYLGGLKDADKPRPSPDDSLRPEIRRELLTVKLRYKKPNEHESLLAEFPLTDSGRRYGEASSDFKFASAVAAFGMILRDSPHRGTATLDGVLELGEDGRGADREGYRGEFLKLVRKAKALRGQ